MLILLLMFCFKEAFYVNVPGLVGLKHKAQDLVLKVLPMSSICFSQLFTY